MIFWTAAILILFIFVWRRGRKFLATRALYRKLPGDPSFSYLYGNLHKYPGPNEEGIVYDFVMSEKHKYLYCLWIGPFVPVVMLYHPDSVRPVLKSSAPKPRHQFLSTAYDMGSRWLGDGLLNSNGPHWHRNRLLLTHAFHFDILKPYVAVYNQCAEIFVSQLKELCADGTSFDIYKPVNMCALDVVLRCAFSYHSDCQVKGENEYLAAMSELMTLWINRYFTPKYAMEWLYGLTRPGRRFYHLCNVVHAVADDIIRKRKQQLENADVKAKIGSMKIRDFLDTLLTASDEHGAGLTLSEIRAEVDTFMFAGHDTTTSAITWTLYRLSQHPEYQERIYQEVVEVLNGRDHFVVEDLSHLEFTTMCIKEAMRLDTPVPLIQRSLGEDTDIAGYTIPAGATVCIHIFTLHHHPSVWDSPNEYRPERFHPDKHHEMDAFQFLPFSAGSRNCIGQHFAMNDMKVIVATIIKNFKLSCDYSKPARRFLTPTLKTENGAMIFAECRQK